nr:D-alanyl-D-alanine carboxypeptidase/D-alanyl-D-alanine-endopeptidase [Sphingomonas sp.]
MSPILRALAMALAIAAASPAAAKEPLQKRVEALLSEAPRGTRFGLVVATEEGRELVAIAPEHRFMPASTTKIFTTAAAFATLPDLSGPDTSGGAAVRLRLDRRGAPDVIIEGRGDARLSSAPGCIVNCLAALADAVAARTRTVDDVIGDGRRFPDERWSPGMSWNNIAHWHGTGISALTLDDNELPMRVVPTSPGKPPRLEHHSYYMVENRAVTVAAGETELEFDRLPGSKLGRLSGTILAGAEPKLQRLGIDDPAHYAAWRLKALLQQRGVRIKGEVKALHRPPLPEENANSAGDDASEEMLARITPPPLAEDILRINKESQNLHAELLLRRVGSVAGDGSIEDGTAAVAAMLERAGVPRTSFDFSDGSGMSTYNRVAPRGVVMLLRWIARQPWGGAWRASLPVAGIDGTLAKRFRGTALRGRLFAKTGTLNATNALAGYMIAASGRTLTFSIHANDVPQDGGATGLMDRALLLIAAEN